MNAILNVSRTWGAGDTGDRMIFQTTNGTRHMYQNRANTFEMDKWTICPWMNEQIDETLFQSEMKNRTNECGR